MFDSKDLPLPIEVEITDFVAEGHTYFNSCYLPAEVLQKEGNFTIGIYGYILNEDESLKKRLSLNPIECKVVKGSYEEITDDAEVPDASVFEIYFNKIAEYEERIEELFDNANESLKKIKHFNSVADMKADTTLLNTYYVKTLGYYEANDGGGADYLIREATASDVDDGGSIHFIDNGLVAELIVEDSVNVKQFGAKGDGITDDTVYIQNCINSIGENTNHVFFNNTNDIYLTDGILLSNIKNVKFYFSGKIHRKSSSVNGSYCFKLVSCENIEFNNSYIYSERNQIEDAPNDHTRIDNQGSNIVGYRCYYCKNLFFNNTIFENL